MRTQPAALLSLALLALPATCSGAAPPSGVGLTRHAFSERHMGTLFQVIVYAPSESVARAGAKDAFARVAALDAIMSDYRPASELMRLCAKAGGPPVKVSDELFTVLARADKVARESGAAFDVTVGPVVRLWRLSRRTGRLPPPEKLKAALALVGYKNVVLDPKAKTVKLLKKDMRLDLGGIAKGYAADEALKALRKHGLDRALVAAGGDIAVGAPPPGTRGWRVAIAPLEGKPDGSHLLLAHAAVSTSGDAEQYVEIGGKRYSHIVDPRTGLGLVGRMSATVVAPDGITSDSLTKVVAVLGPKEGFKVIGTYPSVSARFVRKTDKGTEVVTSKGFPKLHKPPEPGE